MKGLVLFALACWLFPPLGAAVTAILAFIWVVIQVLAVTAVVAAVVAVTYSTIRSWYEPRTISTDTVEAVKREINNAVIVTVGIRNKDGLWKETKDFQGDALSDDLKTKFAGQDRIVLKG